MTKARLRFSTEIVRRLGEELNPSLDKGVIELVKNAYDADATTCRIELLTTDTPGGTVVVTDNGDGMTLDEILDGWLVLGASSKTPQQPTRLDRTPAGSKGLGRLAALRMGSRALLLTRPRTAGTDEHCLLIDWDAFDTATLVDDVELAVQTTRRPDRKAPGTEIRIEELRTGFTRMSVKRLARELVLLADPFADDPHAFRPELRTPEYQDLEALVRRRYFQDAEYHLQAAVDAAGRAHAHVQDWRGNSLFAADHADLAVRTRGAPYRSPPARFQLWVFILNRATFLTRASTVTDVRNWLSEFGGVHFYYNGLRVTPYGNPGDDWLGMNLSRVRSPEERPGTNTSIGRIDVSDTSAILVQKTDRSGFIEDDTFSELRYFAQDALEWMANQRLREAERRRFRDRAHATDRTEKAQQRIQAALNDLPDETRPALLKAFQTYQAARDREATVLRREVQLYRTLSTAGITAAVFAHESHSNPIKVITQSIDAIARRAKKLLGDRYEASLRQPVDSIRGALRSLSVLSAATLRLIDNDKRRISRVDLNAAVVGAVDTFTPFLRGRDVTLRLTLSPGRPYLRGSEAALESIVANLLTNCLAAFEAEGTQDRLVRIATTVSNQTWQLVVEDNGPGIEGIERADIWLPGRTTRKNGTGLGLTIVRDAVRDMGGEVDALEKTELGGAAIVVNLPVLGA